MSPGPDNGLIAVEIVKARSCADIPVVTPSLASIETVKAVSCLDEFEADINGRFKASMRFLVKDKHIKPRP